MNRDILTSSIAATVAAVITQLSYVAIFFGGGRRDDEDRAGGLGAILMLVLGPNAATVVQFALSRTREYSADAASAHMFIVKPFTVDRLQSLFSAHPSTADRIARLQAIR